MNRSINNLKSANLEGLNFSEVWVEANVKRGIPRFTITGLPAASIRESSERVKIAIENSGFLFPMQSILVHLSPAGARKDGTYLDLPIASAILLATEQIPLPKTDLDRILMLGELGLDGQVKPVRGTLNILSQIDPRQFDYVLLPAANAEEAALIPKIQIAPIQHLSDLADILAGKTKKTSHRPKIAVPPQIPLNSLWLFPDQALALRALEITVAGWHHTLLVGSPGSGKSLLANVAAQLLPPASEKEALEILQIQSVQSQQLETLEIKRPFRNPHHTSSDMSLVGGGKELHMGEVTLANRGILFLDELAEFRPSSIQSLREPMEEQSITISRVSGNITYPAKFLLIAASNPCPCGYFHSNFQKCRCSDRQRKQYLAKLSGPFLDRIEIEIELNQRSLSSQNKVLWNLNESYLRICAAAKAQSQRFKNTSIEFNGLLRGDQIQKKISLRADVLEHMERISEYKLLSVRKTNALVKVARTIADLEGSESIEESHLDEAANFQSLHSIQSLAA